MWTGMRGRLPAADQKHLKARLFDTMKEGKRVTEVLDKITSAARSLGIKTPRYPTLIPDYEGLEKNIVSYLDWFTREKARRGLAVELRQRFGMDLDRFDAGIAKVFETAQDVIQESHPDWDNIQLFFGKHGSLKRLAEEASTITQPVKGGGFKIVPRVAGSALDRRIAGWDQIVKESKALLPKLSDDGPLKTSTCSMARS